MQDADVVLATRLKLRSGGAHWVREQARELSIPVIALKDGAEARVASALKIVVGIHPSPGGLFGDPEVAFDADPVHGLAKAVGEPSVGVV